MQTPSLMEAIETIGKCLKKEDLEEEYRIYLESLLKIFEATEMINFSMGQLLGDKEH